MNQKVLHRASTRGHADHGWLNAHHTFSFASYYHPERVHFGALRVLNDDIVEGGTGFGIHAHDNMEIVTIPLQGSLQHRDSMGNTSVIRPNEVQLMTAGTGIQHSEISPVKGEDTNLLQIWVFPKYRDLKPKYDQRKFDPKERINQFQTVVEPSGEKGVKIEQDSWFSLTHLEAGKSLSYQTHLPTNGIYVFVIDGSVEVAGEKLSRRDGLGLWDGTEATFTATENAEILVIEVPMG